MKAEAAATDSDDDLPPELEEAHWVTNIQSYECLKAELNVLDRIAAKTRDVEAKEEILLSKQTIKTNIQVIEMTFANGSLTPQVYFPKLIQCINRDLKNAKAFKALGGKYLNDAQRCVQRYKIGKAEYIKLKKQYGM